MRIGRREWVAGGVLLGTAGVIVAAAVAFAGGTPVGEPPAGQEIVLDTVVRSSDSSVVPTEATSSTSTAAPGTVPGVTVQQDQPPAPANEPAPVETTEPTTEPVETTEPPTTSTSTGEVTAPAPEPDRCWMDNSDPWNYPNGRMICEPAP